MDRKRRIAGLLAAVVALGLPGCGASQIGPDKEAFKAVDALYTAVSLRDSGRLDQCAARLKALGQNGSLPEGAARSVESIIDEARGGRWEPAQERLARFMEGQHR